MAMKSGIFSLFGKTLVISDNKKLLNLAELELNQLGFKDLILETEMPKKIDASVANVIILAEESKLPFAKLSPEGGREHFKTRRVDHEGRRYWIIVSPSPMGRYYGLMEFLQGRDDVDDGPTFELRGVVEGFYGPLWSWEDREKMIRFMSDLRMNLYIYAPKDDPLHRERWRKDYDQETIRQFSSLIQLAESRFISFCFALSPGLSIDYGNEEDIEAVFGKLRQFHEIGVKTFAIFLDDIPNQLRSDSDKKRFGSLGEAQTHFISELMGKLRSLDPEIRLIFCPTNYHGVEGTSYHEDIAKLPEEVHIIWTGPQICSKEIRSSDAERIMKAFGRKVLVWDNYPVNDYDRKRMHLNAVRNRDPDLSETCVGMLSNPMSEAEASKIALFTYGEYLWNPKGYDPEVSLERALTYLFGVEALPIARVLVDNLVDFFFGEDDPRHEWIGKALEDGDDIDLDRVLVKFEQMTKVRDLLSIIENGKFLEELKDHIEKISDIGSLGQLYIQREMLSRKISRNHSKVFSDKVLSKLMEP